MAGSDRNNRRLDEAERARHVAAVDAAAFGLPAGTMRLGLRPGGEAAQHRGDPQPAPPASGSAPPSAHPTEIIPTEQTLHDHQPAPDHSRANSIEAPAANPS